MESNEILNEKLNGDNKAIKQKNTLFYFFLVTVFFLMYVTMDSYISASPIISSSMQILVTLGLVFFSLFCLLIWCFKKHEKRKFHFFGVAVFFYIYSLFSTYINFGLSATFSSLHTISLWFACLAFYWIFTEPEREHDMRRMKKYLFVAYIIFSLGYFEFISDKSYMYGLINALYFGLTLLPIVFLTKNVPIRIGIICIAVLNILLSGKRTAFLVLVAALVLPLLIELFGRGKKTALVTVLVGSIGITWLYNYIIDMYEIDLFERLANIAIDGGSGRSDIYEAVWESFKEADFFGKLFGHGFNGVSLTTSIGTSAHNDFLEVLYDYGIIGITVYGWFVARLIKGAFKLYKVKSVFAPMYLSALVTFLIMSTTSHLIFYSTYVVFLLLFFAIGIWDLNRILKGDKM